MTCRCNAGAAAPGGDGEAPDVGRARRLATRAQRADVADHVRHLRVSRLHRRVRCLPRPSRPAVGARRGPPISPLLPLREHEHHHLVHEGAPTAPSPSAAPTAPSISRLHHKPHSPRRSLRRDDDPGRRAYEPGRAPRRRRAPRTAPEKPMPAAGHDAARHQALRHHAAIPRRRPLRQRPGIGPPRGRTADRRDGRAGRPLYGGCELGLHRRSPGRSPPNPSGMNTNERPRHRQEAARRGVAGGRTTHPAFERVPPGRSYPTAPSANPG